VHDQTLAAYRLIDDLKSRQPTLEIESCSSGGARADLGILSHTDRIWASDCLDALERQQNQRWTGLLLPPELIGSHIGAPTSHTTGRTHTLDFRAGTAFFAHFGIEWDLTRATPADLDALSTWIARHKRFRPLLHTGTVVHADHPDPAHWLHGVVAPDRTEALYAFVSLRTAEWTPPGPLRLPGLNPQALYQIELLSAGITAPDWASAPLTLPGAVLERAGLQAPALRPEQLCLIHASAGQVRTTSSE
jgi:alpha-galactosidase